MIGRVLGICYAIMFLSMSCSPIPNIISAEPTADTPIFAAPTLILSPFIIPSSTPGELYTPTPVPPPADTPTPILIFASPRPGQAQGIRGEVIVSSGPAPAPGAPSFWPGGNLEVIALEAGATRIVATTVTDSQGYYLLELMPGAYNVCVNSHGLGIDRPCDEKVIVTAGNFVRHDMGVAMQ